MNSEKSFMVDKPLAVAASIAGVFLAVMAAILFWAHRPLSAAIFLGLSLLYLGITALKVSVITLDHRGVRKSLFGFCLKSIPWERVREVGVCGTRVFHGSHPEKCGRVFLYFSEERLDKEKRFDMVLKWPPLKKLYLVYSSERLSTVQALWGEEIETYNIGDLIL
jgi:hypothetical protein